MLGITDKRLITNHQKLWHQWWDSELIASEPLHVAEREVYDRINQLLPLHNRQRQPLYGKNFDAELDTELRHLFALAEEEA